MPGYGGWATGPWWNFPIVMPIVMLVAMLIRLLVVRGVVWGGPGTGRQGRPPDGTGEPADPALERLRDRYARGEITEQEYQEMRQLLQR